MKNIVVILISIYLVSCSSSHVIHINDDDSATVNFSVSNKTSLIETLQEWGAVQKSDDLIDTDLIKKDLENDTNISNVDISSPSSNNYTGSFLVNNIDNLFNSKTKDLPKELQIFSLTENGNGKTLKIQISIENYSYLKKALPILQEESIDMLGPEANKDVSKEEYLDMMSFSLGDYGPKDMLDSNIELEISVDGSIVNIEEGVLLSPNKALFNVPLIDVILLKKKLVYSITYK